MEPFSVRKLLQEKNGGNVKGKRERREKGEKDIPFLAAILLNLHLVIC
jgi:hypothetical protein